MRYIEFQKSFTPFTVFSLSDIRQVDPDFHRRRLNEWQKLEVVFSSRYGQIGCVSDAGKTLRLRSGCQKCNCGTV